MIDIALQERLLGEIKYANLLNIFITLGHRDSVTCTGFSHDGVYVATADLSGLVKVWKVQTKQEVFSFECSDAEVIHSFCGICVIVKGGPSGLGTKIVQKYEKTSSLYSQSLLIFIHKTLVVKTIPQEEKLEIHYVPGRHQREIWFIYTGVARSFIYWKYTDKSSNIASDEDTMKNNYM